MLLEFEKPANQSESVKNTRSNYGQKYYDKYATKTKTTSSTTTSTASTASSTKSTVPYKVKVIVDVLNVRKTAGASAAVSTTIKKNGIYTITEEKQVTNTDKTVATWGKLKSGIGWINVGSDYVTKVN
jgi:hypothetical protein